MREKNRFAMCIGVVVAFVVSPLVFAESGAVDVAGWEAQFAFHYDYTLRETAGLARENEPVEITLTVPGPAPADWQDRVRVVRLTGKNAGFLTPHEALGKTVAIAEAKGDTPIAAPAESVNILFLAQCASDEEQVYRLFWGFPAEEVVGKELPRAEESAGLELTGAMPGVTVKNEFFTIALDPKSGAIESIISAGQTEEERLFYKTIPCHFGTDIWSPPEAWDHDYDWAQPPHQKMEGGTTALRVYRWGPLKSYPDVVVSITYTFHAHVPYVLVSSTMRFTQNRSAHAVRMGEIVVSHSKKPGASEDGEAQSPECFTHYGWLGEDGALVARNINDSRNAEGQANVPGNALGGLGILDRDVPWVAGYHAEKGYGLATLRRSQFAGNLSGGPTPQSAPCTYVANYGWGFVYWSRPMVYPLGEKDSALDQNTAIAAGTLFATEEALLVFKPDAALAHVQRAHRGFTQPLKLRFKGTGPW